MPKVSVVMASYNHERFVAETIQSVLDQTYQDFEFIITDDGSPDGTVETIKKFADPRIKLFCFSKNHGACVAMNNCLKEAKGEYIAVINSDDAWMPEKLEKQVKFLDEHPENGAVFGYAQFIDDYSNDLGYDHHYNKIFIQPNRTRFEWLRLFFESGNCLCHPSVLIRKQCYNEVGFYDERFAQLPDFEFWIRLCMKYDIFIMPENLVKFRLCQSQGNASGNTPKNSSRVTLEWAQILKNYLRDEIFDNLVNIFPLTENINELGLSRKINEVERDIAPFFIAMLASRDNRPAHKYFCFDVLYQMYSKKDLAQKLRDQYSFNFSNLVNLAWEQDIFGIVALEQCQSQLHQTELILEQSQSQLHSTQGELEQSQSQLHSTQGELEQSQSQLHFTQGELEQSQSQLHSTQGELEQSQSQLLSTQGELEQSQSQLHSTQGELEQSQSQLHQTELILEQSQSQLHQTELILESIQTQLHQTQGELEQSQAQLHSTQGELEQFQAQLHQTEALLEQFQAQLHQTEALLEQFQAQLHQTEALLEQFQAQLHQTQGELEQSQAQLHQTQGELEQSQAQLHQTQGELEQSQAQLSQTQGELEQSQAQLSQTDGELKRTQSQLHKADEELKRTQSQLHQTQEEVAQSQVQLHQTQEEAAQSQVQLHQTQEEVAQSQKQLHQTQEEVAQSQMQLHQAQEEVTQFQVQLHQAQEKVTQFQVQLHQSQQELERLRFERSTVTQTHEETQKQYKLLVWDAWYAHYNGDLTKMRDCLYQSLKFTPCSRTETFVSWLETFAKLSSEKGYGFDTHSLCESEEWKQLVHLARGIKPALTETSSRRS